MLTLDEYLRRLYPYANDREFKVMWDWVNPAAKAQHSVTWDPSPAQLDEIRWVHARLEGLDGITYKGRGSWTRLINEVDEGRGRRDRWGYGQNAARRLHEDRTKASVRMHSKLERTMHVPAKAEHCAYGRPPYAGCAAECWEVLDMPVTMRAGWTGSHFAQLGDSFGSSCGRVWRIALARGIRGTMEGPGAFAPPWSCPHAFSPLDPPPRTVGKYSRCTTAMATASLSAR